MAPIPISSAAARPPEGSLRETAFPSDPARLRRRPRSSPRYIPRYIPVAFTSFNRKKSSSATLCSCSFAPLGASA